MTETTPKKLLLAKQIESEVIDYITKDVDQGDNIKYSQHRLTKRIALFESKTYPNGKFTKAMDYKYWYDIIGARINAEVKNVDFDTKNIEAYSFSKLYQVPDIIVNLQLTQYLKDNGKAEEINTDIEQGAGWGNVAWKKVGKDYESSDLRNFYVINQTAETLNDSPVIERYQFSQSKLNKMKSNPMYYNMANIISSCGENTYKANEGVIDDAKTTTPYYLLFERNGEVSLEALREYRISVGIEVEPITGTEEEVLEKTKLEKETYVYAKVIGAGTQSKGGSIKIKYIAFGEETEMPFKEYHRSAYKGRWMREGLYELLFDLQVRGNEIGNQLARGLEFASKTIFKTNDKLFVQNIITDLQNGDILKSKDIEQIQVRMQGADQLIADWNRVIVMANEIANSREIVQGESSAGQPFRLGALLNTNANKLFDFIREKFAIPLREMFEETVIPGLVSELKMKDIIRLTGDPELLDRMIVLIVDDWYVRNLVNLPAHGEEAKKIIKGEKIAELKKDKKILLTEFNKLFKGYKALVSVIITGENVDLPEKLQTLATFIQLESDPVRRSHLVEKAMKLKGMDVADLPRSNPEILAGAGAVPSSTNPQDIAVSPET